MHNQFALFSAKYSNGSGLPQLLKEIGDWVVVDQIAPKSVGVEYLESKDEIVISIGYNDTEVFCPVELVSVEVGKLDLNNLPGTEDAMSKAAARVGGDIICHELFVTDDGSLTLIFMRKA